MRFAFLAILLASTFLMIGLLNTSFSYVQASGEDKLRSQCYEYEESGAIPKNSCSCTEELYPNYSVSYDWMDSCKILEHIKSRTPSQPMQQKT